MAFLGHRTSLHIHLDFALFAPNPQPARDANPLERFCSLQLQEVKIYMNHAYVASRGCDPNEPIRMAGAMVARARGIYEEYFVLFGFAALGMMLMTALA